MTKTARKLDLRKIQLKAGSHDPDHTFCLLEAVAYVAGEEWSDRPATACPVLSAFGRTWNDSLDDKDRQRLKPYVRKLVGTKSTPEVESVRSWMACDWLVRTFTPAWLRLADLGDHADKLEALPALTSDGLAKAAMPIISAADSAACSAAYSAADSAAYSAADSAAYSAAYSAADSAAGSAAGSAAYSAACSAAYSAAYSAVAPTVSQLQDSALDLFDRMIAVQS